MALGVDAVRRLTIVASERGLTEVNQKLRENERVSNAVAAAQTRMATATAAADARMQALLRQRDRLSTAMQGQSALGVAGTAAGAVAPYAVAAAGVIATIAAMNAVYQRGAELLEKYGNAQRQFDRSDTTSNLADLTKFQGNKETAAQQQWATDLGVRLQDANFQIEKFLKTSLDITDPALKLQSIWVRVVELIATATGGIDLLLEKMSKLPSGPGPGALALVPGGAVAYGAYKALSTPAPAAPTAAESMGAARGRLASGLETSYIGREGAPDRQNTFAGRYVGDVDALKKGHQEEKKVANEARDAWDRALDSVSRSIALQEAEQKAVGMGVAAQARYRTEAQLTEAAERAGVEITGERAKKYEELANRAERAALALGEARLKDDARFELSQLGRSDGEAGIASKLRSVYGNQYESEMGGAIAAQLRLNETIKQGRDVITDFATGFTRDIRNGVSAVEALNNALKRVADRMIDIAIQKSAAGLIGSLSGPAPTVYSGEGNPWAAGGMNPIGAAVAHAGWVVGSGSAPGTRYVDPAVFANAPRYHSGGIAGDEVAAILQKGERVIPRGGGEPNVNVVIQNESGARVERPQAQRNSQGGIDLKVMIRDVVKSEMGSGGMDDVMSRFGNAPRAVSR